MRVESSVSGQYVAICMEAEAGVVILEGHSGRQRTGNCLTPAKFRRLAEYGLSLCDEIDRAAKPEPEKRWSEERDRLLAVATPEEWAEWLEKVAPIECSIKICLFCLAYPGKHRPDCISCTGIVSGCVDNRSNKHGEGYQADGGRVGAARDRLECAGILPLSSNPDPKREGTAEPLGSDW